MTSPASASRAPAPLWRTLLTRALPWQVAACTAYTGELLANLAQGELVDARQWLLGAGAGFLLVFTAALPIALLVAVASASMQRVSARPWRPLARVRGWVRDGSVEEQRDRVATICASLVALLAFLGLSYRASLEVVLGIARPENTAAIVAMLHVALGLVAWGILRASAAAVRGALTLVGRWSGGSSWLDSVTHVGFVLATLLLMGVAGLAYAIRDTLAQVPWRVLEAPAVALLFACLGLAIAFRARAARVLGWSFAALWLASWSTPLLLRASDYGAISLFERELHTPALVSGALTRVTDRDGDGHRSWLGGGDCRPDDRRVYPGALDIPGNRLDEDCDGQDLRIPKLFARTAPPFHELPARVPERPDIVLITVDAFAARHLAAFGAAHDVAPNIEALIRGGVLFDKCFAQGPSTRLSFPALFTSRYDSEIDTQLVGRMPYPLGESNETIAELLKARGYHTAAVVPTHYFTPRVWRGLTQGFDVVDTSATTRDRGGPPFNAEKVNAAALKQLASPKLRSPLFMWVHYYDAHAPHAVPRGVEARGSDKKGVYDAELSYVDQHVGKLVAAVRKQLGDDTLIVLTGDHGYGFEGVRYARGGYGYDLNTLTLHVPLVFSAAFLDPARRSTLCSTLDVLPTLMNFVRAPSRAGWRGHSLVSEIVAGRTTRPQLLFHQSFLPEKLYKKLHPLKLVSVRTPEYNYVLDRSTGVASLWKWSTDYDERVDLLRTGKVDPAVRNQLTSFVSAFVYESLRGMKLQAPAAAGAAPTNAAEDADAVGEVEP